MCWALIAGCEGVDGEQQVVGIGSGGGSIELSDGASISVPSGSVPDGVRVTAHVRTGGVPMADGLEVEGKIYAFLPHGTRFSKPALIKIPVVRETGRPFTLDDEQDESWAEVPMATTRGGFHELTVEHISLFAELAPVVGGVGNAGAGGSESGSSGGGSGGSSDTGGTADDGGDGAGGGAQAGAGGTETGSSGGGSGGGVGEGGDAGDSGGTGDGGDAAGAAGQDGGPATAITRPGRICAGSLHGCAILRAGEVACWGGGYSGQLGDGIVYEESPQGIARPQLVVGIDSAVQIACEEDFSVALLADGTILSWGSGNSGQMGDGTLGSYSSPRLAAVEGAVQVSAGRGHVCALLDDETVACWGRGDFGQLGNGVFAPSGTGGSALPQAVTGLDSVKAVSAGGYHTCALRTEGSVVCWGRNDYGQLGVPTIDRIASPVTVANLSNVVQISAGWNHTCALIQNGSVRCWGLGDLGQRGDGVFHPEFPANPTASTVVGEETYVLVHASAFHTCGIESAGGVRCWGSGETGMLGDGLFDQRAATPQTVQELEGVEDVYLGTDNSCARLQDQSVWCWGWGWLGALGNGNLYEVPPDTYPPASEQGSAVPVRVLDIP